MIGILNNIKYIYKESEGCWFLFHGSKIKDENILNLKQSNKKLITFYNNNICYDIENKKYRKLVYTDYIFEKMKYKYNQDIYNDKSIIMLKKIFKSDNYKYFLSIFETIYNFKSNKLFIVAYSERLYNLLYNLFEPLASVIIYDNTYKLKKKNDIYGITFFKSDNIISLDDSLSYFINSKLKVVIISQYIFSNKIDKIKADNSKIINSIKYNNEFNIIELDDDDNNYFYGSIDNGNLIRELIKKNTVYI